jgi:hypothetical protein
MLASARLAEGERGIAPGPRRQEAASERRYAALFAAWGDDCYWEAEVLEDEHGPRVSVVAFPEARGAAGRARYERTDVKTVADAIRLAERLRDVAVECRAGTAGPPARIDLVIEETGDGERMETLKRTRSWWPGRPPEPKQYALLVARWRAAEWVAAVVEDELGIRVVHQHTAACSDGSCGVDTTRPSWTVADAIALAEKKRDEVDPRRARLPGSGPRRPDRPRLDGLAGPGSGPPLAPRPRRGPRGSMRASDEVHAPAEEPRLPAGPAGVTG